MTIDELRTEWVALDAKVTRGMKLQAAALREQGLGRVGAALRGTAGATLLQLLLNVVVVVWLGNFLWEHRDAPRFLAPALALDVGAIALIVLQARQLATILGLDYGAPIVTIQRRLEELRLSRIATTKWVVLLAPLLWTPLLIVALEGFLGVDAFASLSATWLWANLLFGVAAIPVLLGAARRAKAHVPRSPFLRAILDDIAGRSLVRAKAFLGEIERFGAEE
jgi:hypothetical protein